MLRLFLLKFILGGFGGGIVGADLSDEAAVTRRSRIRDDYTEEGFLSAA